MATTEVGDWQVPTLTVNPADGTTAATLTVVAPDGTTTAPVPTTANIGLTWTAPGYAFTMPGEWVERWTVAGTGKGVERRVILVSPDPTDLPTGTRVYATTADYARMLGAAPPSGARRALAEASATVDDMLLTSVYDTDPVTLLPTLPAVITALRDATCAQADYSRAIGDRNAIGASQLHSFTIGSVSATRGYSSTGSTAPGKYSPKAWAILQRAKLTSTPPWGY